MATPNMHDPLFANIVAVIFQGTRNSTITFLSAPNASIVI